MEGIEALITTPDPEWPGGCVFAALEPGTRVPVMLRLKGLDWDSKTCLDAEHAFVLGNNEVTRVHVLLLNGIARTIECIGPYGKFRLLVCPMSHSDALRKV